MMFRRLMVAALLLSAVASEADAVVLYRCTTHEGRHAAERMEQLDALRAEYGCKQFRYDVLAAVDDPTTTSVRRRANPLELMVINTSGGTSYIAETTASAMRILDSTPKAELQKVTVPGADPVEFWRDFDSESVLRTPGQSGPEVLPMKSKEQDSEFGTLPGSALGIE